MKITKLSLRDFRAFAGPEKHDIDLNQGSNLLLYGENGSGKSSIFEGLRGLLNHDHPIRFEGEFGNVFTGADDGYVSIEISHANPNEYRWDYGEVPSGSRSETQYLDIARRAVFLDYRSLLETHFIHREAPTINIFDLLVKTILSDVDFGDGRSVSEHWQKLKRSGKNK